MKLLLIDNYDSFTYNLEHYLSALGLEVVVKRHDKMPLEDAESFDLIMISPGPGLPQDAGITPLILEKYLNRKPILGICLGAQAIAEHYGASLYNQQEVAHGISRSISIGDSSWLFNGLAKKIPVGLYHSWAIKPAGNFEAKFKLTAWRENGVLMAFEDPNYPTAGVQFHPESIMTEGGRVMLENWLTKAKQR